VLLARPRGRRSTSAEAPADRSRAAGRLRARAASRGPCGSGPAGRRRSRARDSA
jgi:hypothetical protein